MKVFPFKVIVLCVFISFCSCNVKKSIPLSVHENVVVSNNETFQDETPQLVSNSNGEAWMFSLSRYVFPMQKEVISAYYFDGKSWSINPIAKSPVGEYETPTAACSKNGTPAVAWATKDGLNWGIAVSFIKENSFSEAKLFHSGQGKFINPVLIAPSEGSCFLAWESYSKGKFSIMASQYKNNNWSNPTQISEVGKNCWDPAIASSSDGRLYLAYTVADGVHQNIEMNIIDGSDLKILKNVPVAIGGAFKDRVNLNSKPALAFDTNEKLWISWESNRNNSRLEDSDCYTGDRICPIACYDGEKLMSPSNNEQLFYGANDHFPTFAKDLKNRLYMLTCCGGDFTSDYAWKYRISWLDPQKGWTSPDTLLQTSQKGFGNNPQIAFTSDDKFWFAYAKELQEKVSENSRMITRKNELHLLEIKAPVLTEEYAEQTLEPRQVEEYHPVENFHPYISGRLRAERKTLTVNGETYTLLYGNLHEHTNISECWPAGCDGSFDENYRYGLFSEGYDFMSLTDHGNPHNEVQWRKHLRMAEFYNDPSYFVALPGIEWTLSSEKPKEKVDYASGHRNIIFSSTEEALKYIKDEKMIYSARVEETGNAEKLWDLIHEKDIDCVSIPHHASDEIHPVCWETHDEKLETVVEIFQCRGSAEYPGCPKEVNLTRHRVSPFQNTYVDYALREKKYKMGFVASGDHNSMGVGVAALWVKEVSREGILEALRNKRVYATTGDKMVIDFRIGDAIGGETVKSNENPKISFSVKTVQPIKSVELLKNSRVVHTFDKAEGKLSFSGSLLDKNPQKEDEGVVYYYLRVIQDNTHIGWSSPIWVETI